MANGSTDRDHDMDLTTDEGGALPANAITHQETTETEASIEALFEPPAAPLDTPALEHPSLTPELNPANTSQLYDKSIPRPCRFARLLSGSVSRQTRARTASRSTPSLPHRGDALLGLHRTPIIANPNKSTTANTLAGPLKTLENVLLSRNRPHNSHLSRTTFIKTAYRASRESTLRSAQDPSEEEPPGITPNPTEATPTVDLTGSTDRGSTSERSTTTIDITLQVGNNHGNDHRTLP